jgi:hypothetical protein
MKNNKKEDQKNSEDKNSVQLKDIVITLIVVIFACTVIIFLSIYPIPSVALSGAIIVIISAFTGGWITIVVTRLLLSQQQKAQKELIDTQTAHEHKKELDTKKFEEKLKTYQKFLETLCEIIKKESKVSKQDIKELIFQIAMVRMHTTNGEHVNALFEAISKIVENINNKIVESSNKSNLTKLTEHILDVIKILQQELYTKDEIGDLDSKKFEDSLDILTNYIDWIEITDSKSDSDGIPYEPENNIEKGDKKTITDNINTENIENIETITKRFEEALKERLQNELKAPYNNVEYSLKGKETPGFIVRSKEWGNDDFCICLTYDDPAEVYISIHGAKDNDYKDMYLHIRRILGGRFNKGNWFMCLEEPYNQWVYTDKGREIFSNLDEKMMTYICDLFIKSIECYSTIRKIMDLRNLVDKKNDDVRGWINYGTGLVHDYKINDDGEERTITIETYYSDDKWQIEIYDRGAKNTVKLKEFLPKVVKDYPVEREEGNVLFLKPYSCENLSVIAEWLKGLRAIVEDELKKLQK